MKKVSFTAKQVETLRWALDYCEKHTALDAKGQRAAREILEKLAAAELKSAPSANAPALEEMLIQYAGGKVVALALPNWPRYARQATLVGATPADAQTVGRWLARQDWIRPGSMTLQNALNNWSGWLGKAQAEMGTTAAPEAGIGARNLGQGPAAQRQVPAARRPASGIGRKVA